MKRFFRSGCAKKQVVDGGGEGSKFALALNLGNYFVVFPNSFNLQPNWGFEVVRRNRLGNGFRGFLVFVLKRDCCLQASHPSSCRPTNSSAVLTKCNQPYPAALGHLQRCCVLRLCRHAFLKLSASHRQG